jgi:hypothetical protein
VQVPKGLQSWMFGGRVATGLGIGCARTNAVSVRNPKTRLRFAGGPRCGPRTKLAKTSPERGPAR